MFCEFKDDRLSEFRQNGREQSVCCQCILALKICVCLCFPHVSLTSRFKMADDFSNMDKTDGRCMTCSDGMQHKEATNMGAGKALELVHVEACGPTRIPIIIGAWYFMQKNMGILS